MIQHKNLHPLSSRKLLPFVAATSLLFPLAVVQVASGSPRTPGVSKVVRLPIEDSMTLQCETTAFTSTTGDSKGIKSEAKPAKGGLTFTAANGQFAFVGPLGTEKLRLVSTSISTGSMFFEYMTPDRNAQLWSFHRLKDGRILFSNQLSANNSLGADENIMIVTNAGYCRASGGNGQPIRK